MKHYFRKVSLIILFLVLQAFAISNVFAQQEFSVESTNLQIYRDGLVTINQKLNVEELFPQFIVPIVDSSIENIIVLDQDQRAVDYEIKDYNLTIYSLGASQISIEYETFALTNKQAEIWSIIIENQYDISVSLPKNSTVVYLSKMPNTIDTQENVITFTLYPSQWEINYVLSPSSTDDNGQTDQNLIPTEYFIAILGITALLVVFIFFFRKKRKPNIKKIFKTYPQLSKEDKAVIEFLAENEGRAFEAEIREKFPDLPRTSLWRLVRRLERMEIVEINKIGLENQVKLK